MTGKQPHDGVGAHPWRDSSAPFKGEGDVELLLLRMCRASNATPILYFDRYLFPQKIMNFTRQTGWKMIKWTYFLGVKLLGYMS